MSINTTTPSIAPFTTITPPAIIALTGASGLLGGALSRALLARGFRVRALFRRHDPAWNTLDGAETVLGDLADEAALAHLVAGTVGVMHIAAMYRSDGSLKEFLDVNLHGTARLLLAAQTAGVRRFVYCSTIGVHGSVAETPADEHAPFDPRDAYQESKLRAEELCRAAVGASTTEIVILRPCGIYGPGDTRLLKMFRMMNRPAYVQVGEARGNFHPVYIDDLVDGFLRALMVPGIDGETFIIGGPEYLPLSEMFAAAATALGTKPIRIKVSYKPVELAAWACEGICNVIGVEPPLHRRRLTFFKHNRAFSIQHARQLLGYAPQVHVGEGFDRTVDWYRVNRLIQ